MVVASSRLGSSLKGKGTEEGLAQSESGLLLDFIASEPLLSFACPLYRIVNYQKGGSLVEAYRHGGDDEVVRFAADHLEQFMLLLGRRTPGDLTYRNSNEVVAPVDAVKDSPNIQDFVLPEKVCWRREYRGFLGESALHVLIFCNTPMHINIAKILLENYPELSRDVIEGEDYCGVSALHLAIAFKNFELVKILVHSGADIFQRAVGRFFLPFEKQHKQEEQDSDPRNSFYMGEYPLAWAACHEDESAYNLLISNGAHPDTKDSFGNTVLHVVVVRNKLPMYGYALRHPVKPARDNILNNNGLSPLTLACKLGRNDIFREMLELSAVEFWRYSNITCSAYPLNVLDSISPDGNSNKNSALMIILNGTSKEHLDMLDSEVIQRILEDKWKTFARKLFLKRLILMLLHLVMLSLAVYLRPNAEMSLQPRWSDASNVLRFCSEIGVCLTCGAFIIFQEVKEIKARGLLVFLMNLSSNVPKAIFLLSDLLLLLCPICRLIDERCLEDSFFSIAAAGSWIYLLFFAGAVRLTGPFITMISKMLTGDMFRFCIIYFIFLLGFTQAFNFVSKNSKPDTQLPETYPEAWMSLLHHTLGVYEYGDLDDTVYPMLSKMVFTVFMVVMPILLLNMLIAMMGTTYIKVIRQSEREWMRQWAQIVLLLEHSIAQDQAKDYLNSYSIALPSDGSSETENRAILVIKTKSITKAKQHKRALSNWKRVGKRLVSAVRQCGGTAEGVHTKLLSGAALRNTARTSDDKNKREASVVGLLSNALQQLDFAHDLQLDSIMNSKPLKTLVSDESSKTESSGNIDEKCPTESSGNIDEKCPTESSGNIDEKCQPESSQPCPTECSGHIDEKCPTESTRLLDADIGTKLNQCSQYQNTSDVNSNNLTTETQLTQNKADIHSFYDVSILKDVATQYNIHPKKCDASTLTNSIFRNLSNAGTEPVVSRNGIQNALQASFVVPSDDINDISHMTQYHKSCQVNTSQKMTNAESYVTHEQTTEMSLNYNLQKNIKSKKSVAKKIKRKKVNKYDKKHDESESDDDKLQTCTQNNLFSNSTKIRFLKLCKRKSRKNRVSDTV